MKHWSSIATARIDKGHGHAILVGRQYLEDFKVGDTVRFSPNADESPRPGSIGITRVDLVDGVLYTDCDVRSAIPSMVDGDYIVIETEDAAVDDHEALVNCLLSGVRRRDWHLVSDMANDLRVLEARRR